MSDVIIPPRLIDARTSCFDATPLLILPRPLPFSFNGSYIVLHDECGFDATSLPLLCFQLTHLYGASSLFWRGFRV